MSARTHAEAVEQTLEAMRAKYAAMPRAIFPADRHSRAITLALHEALFPLFAAQRDKSSSPASDEAFAQGFTHAVGNVICSMASSFLPADTPPEKLTAALVQQTAMLSEASMHRALQRAMDPSRGVVVWSTLPQNEAAT